MEAMKTSSDFPAFGVLWLPEFRLQAAALAQPEISWQKQPLGLVSTHSTSRRSGTSLSATNLLAVNAAARAHGLTTEMSVSRALARCESLQLLEADPVMEERLQAHLLAIASGISARVEQTDAGCCTMDLRGCTRPAPVWVNQALNALRQWGAELRIGTAPDPDLARWAAMRGRPHAVVEDTPEGRRQFVNSLSIEDLFPKREVRELLVSWGIRTAADLLALPVEEVVRRLRPEVRVIWDWCRPTPPRPLQCIEDPPTYRHEVELDHPIERLEPLMFRLRDLLEKLLRQMEDRWLVFDGFVLELGSSSGRLHRKEFRTVEPTRDLDVLTRLLNAHLENFRSPEPIDRLMIEARPAPPRFGQTDLFEATIQYPHRLAETIARLEAKLGRDRVGYVEPGSTHRPESWVMRPFTVQHAMRCARSRANQTPVPSNPGTSSPPVSLPSPTEICNPPPDTLPMYRFRPPVRATVRCDTRGVPRWIECPKVRGSIRDYRGPWILSGHWWDEGRWSRREWEIEVENAGLFHLTEEEKCWHVEGIYG